MGEVVAVFDSGDVIGMADLQEYVSVIKDAFNVHYDRERIRHGLWKDYPAGDQANQIKIKIDRVLRSLELLPPPAAGSLTEEGEALVKSILEEIPDIINYAIFTARKLKGE